MYSGGMLKNTALPGEGLSFRKDAPLLALEQKGSPSGGDEEQNYL